MRKKVDSRVRTVLVNAVKTHQRSFFVIVGDKGREQVVNLHYILSKTLVKARPSVLWCYKKDLGFSSNRQKRMKQIKKMMQRGLLDPNEDDPFELFISSTDIRYCYYKDTQKILGNTYGMCVLQDFEAITPNVLARTIETVEGGGIVVVLLKTMQSLKQFYTMNMDVHSRFRTEARQDVVARFNERFILSLATCPTCLVVDDELNVLPISSHARNIQPVHSKADGTEDEHERELREVKESLADEQPIGALVAGAKTVDQARAVLTFVEAIAEKTLSSTVTLTAARGRGKSASLGVAMAAAVAYGYSNIFVTSPSPENLKTLFEFVFKGFDALGYQEHTDYELVQSTNPSFNKAIVRVNIFRQHRQTIQYVQPEDASHLGQAELLVIDEAAAIPLPLVKELLGKYLVFMSSTINGYEGTGRSLSLKLMKKLREDSTTAAGGRQLREITLEEPIRYAKGDPVEKWLNTLLCLDVADIKWTPSMSCPHPDECELYYINRDTLFSFHKASEAFLRRMMALYVSSHYKNSPNDLQMMSDAPSHQLFVLLGPVDPDAGTLPDILAVVQVCLEGDISRQSVLNTLSRGQRAAGDLIPWTVSQQFQDPDFASLSGARIVRIATHPNYTRMGYGSKAIELIGKYYQGDIISAVGAAGDSEDSEEEEEAAEDGPGLNKELLAPRRKRKPLLVSLAERRPERLHYVGVSFGLTESLYSFWKKAGYSPVYVRQTPNDLTGEHTCIMLKELESSDLVTTASSDWLSAFHTDFKRRFVSLLGFEFSRFPPSLALSVLSPPRLLDTSTANPESLYNPITKAELEMYLTLHDLKRLEGYASHLVDYHVVTDLVPVISRLYFLLRIPVTLSPSQLAILASLGLQHVTVDNIAKNLGLPGTQVLALFNKAIRKLASHFRSLFEAEVEKELAPVTDAADQLNPLMQSLDADLEDGGAEAREEMSKKFKSLLKEDAELSEYAVNVDDATLEAAMGKKGVPASISVKSTKKRKRTLEDPANEGDGNAADVGSAKKRKKQKGSDGPGSAKKKKKKVLKR